MTAPEGSTIPEIHPALSAKELDDIREFREKLAYKTVEETHKLYFEWARTGKLSRRQHTLLGKYIFCGA